MLTSAIQVQKYVRASAGRAGLNVVFEDNNQPRHDGKTIYLPKITYKTTEAELLEMMSSTDNEVAHDLFSSFDVLLEKKDVLNKTVMFVWNFLEDSRVNTIEANVYRGFRENWDEAVSKTVLKILKETVEDASPFRKLVRALLCWEAPLLAYNFPKIDLVVGKAKADPKILDVLNNYSKRLLSCHLILDKKVGTTATYDLAIDILKDLKENCKEELKEVEKPVSSSSKKSGEGEKTKATASKGETSETGFSTSFSSSLQFS